MVDLVVAAAKSQPRLGCTAHLRDLKPLQRVRFVGIDAVDEELRWVRESGDQLRSKATKIKGFEVEGLDRCDGLYVGEGVEAEDDLGVERNQLPIFLFLQF